MKSPISSKTAFCVEVRHELAYFTNGMLDATFGSRLWQQRGLRSRLRKHDSSTVSYTHLTLPTILLV
eukprot:2211674-Amphidinium_carterae.1